MLTLYHNGMSTCSQKVRLALAEKNLDWEGRHLDLRAGETHTPEYLELNPRGVVPTLVHDGQVVRESNVILEYLDDAFPDPPLRPDSPIGRARVRLWLKRLDEGHHDLATSTLSMAVAFRHQYLAKGTAESAIASVPDPVRRERRRDLIRNGTEAREFPTAIGMWVRLIEDMETALRDSPWLAGEGYSIADAAWTPYIVRLDHLRALELVARKPRLIDWHARVQARPAYRKAMTDWFSPDYLSLMAEKGEEAWPRIAEIAAAQERATARERQSTTAG